MCLDARYVHATRTAYTSRFENSGLVVPNCAPEHICHCVVKKTVIKAAKRFSSGFLKFLAIPSWRMYVLRCAARTPFREVLSSENSGAHACRSCGSLASFALRASARYRIDQRNREHHWLREKPALKFEQWSDAITKERIARLTRPARCLHSTTGLPVRRSACRRAFLII